MSQPIHQPAAAPAALSDEEVVARVLAGDTSLFEILMRRYNQRLFRVARAILADDAEAEDVMQEAYVRAFRELSGFRGDARFATWLTRIACHEALARARKRRRLVSLDPGGSPAARTGATTGAPPDPPDASSPEREMENRELQAILQAAVEALPDPLRAVFCLREIEGLSTEQTAEALGLTVENVRVRLHRARLSLRQTLDARIGREVRRLYLFDGRRCDRVVEGVFARLLEAGPAQIL
ncbi:MAG TPA: RNA polymerase sigma factor [Thermoanaerobaculia bacterium]|nr:RNA polymerase sigma factor [Thermoanaerobaculia bacterium]